MAHSEKVSTQRWKCPSDYLPGYTGQVKVGRKEPENETHILDTPLKKSFALGYTGFIPDRKNICGTTEVRAMVTTDSEVKSQGNDFTTSFRVFAKHMDLHERYQNATSQLLQRGQSQQMLLRIVQAKLSERVTSYAQQRIHTRLLFEAFDFNKDGVLDEHEFRECLEKMNCQFDDIQSLALFAYFDEDYDGCLNWEEFAEKSMVPNPKGGVAIIPKQITSTMKNGDWSSLGTSFSVPDS